MNHYHQVLSKIMTPAAYAQLDHDTPYVFTLSGQGSAVFYFGARHSSDPSDQMFDDIRDAFVGFKPDVVFVEGVQSDRVKKHLDTLLHDMSYQEAIERGGEPIYALKMAAEQGIEWICPEPKDAALYHHLLTSGFARDHIAAWNVVHLLQQWQRRNETMSFKEYTKRFRERFAEDTQWPDFDYSFERALSVAAAVTGRTVRVENYELGERIADPTPWPGSERYWSVFNRISQVSSQYRDEVIVTQIADELKHKKRVFVVYGASHAVMQEPALRLLLE